MNIQQLDPVKIRKLGLEAVEKRLGPTGMIHFLRQFKNGSGDYTKERVKWLKDASTKSIVESAKKRRKAKR
jgi:hypothetical protein